MKKYLFFVAILFLWSCKKDTENTRPTTQDLTESVYTSVTIQPDSLYQAYASVAGILDQNLVEEGDLVTKGQALSQIINNTPV